mgnify:FL=1
MSLLGTLAQGQQALEALAGVLLLVVLLGGVGCIFLVIRVILAGPTARADEALATLGTPRLFLTGVLPLLGAALLGHASQFGGQVAQGAFALLVGLPALLLVLLGGAAAIPYLGRQVLRGRREPTLLAAAVVGAIVLGLAGAAAAVLTKEGGVAILSLLVASWFLGAGLGAILPARSRAP